MRIIKRITPRWKAEGTCKHERGDRTMNNILYSLGVRFVAVKILSVHTEVLEASSLSSAGVIQAACRCARLHWFQHRKRTETSVCSSRETSIDGRAVAGGGLSMRKNASGNCRLSDDCATRS